MSFVPIQRQPGRISPAVRIVLVCLDLIALAVFLWMPNVEKIGKARWFATFFAALAVLGISLVYVAWKEFGWHRPRNSDPQHRPIG